jgi:hypothetical protein
MKLSDKSSYHRRARKTWEGIHGKRPRDDQGARFHCHHIDGDIENNSIDNLLCISQRTHREIHCGRSYTMHIDNINHVKNNTVPVEIDLMTFSELVDLLVLTMTQLGTELTAENGGRDGWEDLVNLPDDALADDGEFDVVMDKVHSFIWDVAYPVALSELKPE